MDAADDTRARNAANAHAFHEMMFNDNRPRDAVAAYVGETFIEHDPRVADGVEGLVAYSERMAAAYRGKRVEIKRTVAEGDLVVLHGHQTWPGDTDYAAIDIFRFDADGRIVEHWNVLQPMPVTSENDNGMF